MPTTCIISIIGTAIVYLPCQCETPKLMKKKWGMTRILYLIFLFCVVVFGCWGEGVDLKKKKDPPISQTNYQLNHVNC